VFVARHRPDLSAALITEFANLARRFLSVNPVLSQLILGISAAAVRMPCEPPLSQVNVLQNLITVCSGNSLLLLRVLSTLAEEVVTSSMSPNLRAQWTTVLRGPGAELCFRFVLSCLSEEPQHPTRTAACLSVLASWLAQEVVGWNHISPFLPFLVRELHASPSPHEALADIFVSVCELHASTGCATVLSAIVSHPCAEAGSLGSLELSRLLILCARPSLQSQLDADMQAVWPRVLNALLLCLQREHLELLVRALEFWADYAASKLTLLTPDEHHQLLNRCVLCGEYPADFPRWSLETREQFQDMRNDLRNTLRPLSMAQPTAGPWLLAHLVSSLCQENAQLQSNLASFLVAPIASPSSSSHPVHSLSPIAASPQATLDVARLASSSLWLRAEAVVHSATAIAKLLFDAQAGPELRALQCTLIDCLSAMPMVPGLQRTVVTLGGLIGDWLSHQQDRITQVLHLVIRSLHLPEWDPVYPMRINEDHVAGVALVKLARLCSSPAVLQELFAAVCFVCGPHSVLTRKSARLVLQALCVATHLTDNSWAVQYARSIALFALDALARAPSEAVAVECINDLGVILAHLRDAAWGEAAGLALYLPAGNAAVVDFSSQLQPALNEFSNSLVRNGSPLHHVFVRFAGSQAVPEAVGNALTSALVHAKGGAALAVFAQGACTMLASNYPQCSLAVSAEVFRCTLEAGSGSRTGADSLKTVVSSETATLLAPMALSMLEFVSRLVLSSLEHSAATVKSSFLFFACILRTLPSVIAPPLAVQLALAALRLLGLASVSHCRESASAVLAFLRELILATGHELHSAVFHDANGVEMCRVLLGGARGGLPGWMLEDIVAVFRALFKVDAVHAGAWLAAADSAAGKQLVPDLLRFAGDVDLPRFKNALKHFCGGKKKGTEGTPQRSQSNS
jgi:hypothetical protein